MAYIQLIEEKKQNYKIVVDGNISFQDFNTWHPQFQKVIDTLKTHPHKTKIIIEITKNSVIDQSSAFIFIQELAKNVSIEVDLVQSDHVFKKAKVYKPTLPTTPLKRNRTEVFLENLGHWSLDIYKATFELLSFFGYVVDEFMRSLSRVDKFPLIAFCRHIETTGFQAIGIIGLISFLIGMVLAYQGINQLSRFGAEIFTIDFLTIGVFREIGVLLTAVVIAGRSSSSFTAQIGTMSLNQEIDAMRILQLDPVLMLALPRIAALLVSLPLLVFFSDIMAMAGGMLTTELVIDLSPSQFMLQFQRVGAITHFWVGMSKAPLFAIIIGVVGCFRGMQVRESAEHVGKMTTSSVVEAIFLVIICDAIMSLLFSYYKI
jgi:phospholipid/cholesterol/gamma-HCH transport system permease protein